MSKIQIEQVDRLEEESKVVRYEDLEAGEWFIKAGDTKSGLLLKTVEGYVYLKRAGHNPNSYMPDDEPVIPVKAKILWCREGGGGE